MIETFKALQDVIRQCTNMRFQQQLQDFLDERISLEILRVRADLERSAGYYRRSLWLYLGRLESL